MTTTTVRDLVTRGSTGRSNHAVTGPQSQDQSGDREAAGVRRSCCRTAVESGTQMSGQLMRGHLEPPRHPAAVETTQRHWQHPFCTSSSQTESPAPYSGSTRQYTADFADASGLRPNARRSYPRSQGRQGHRRRIAAIGRQFGGGESRVHRERRPSAHRRIEGGGAVREPRASGYLDVTGADGNGPSVRHLSTENTVSSFDVTELFNGLQPRSMTLSLRRSI